MNGYVVRPNRWIGKKLFSRVFLVLIVTSTFWSSITPNPALFAQEPQDETVVPRVFLPLIANTPSDNGAREIILSPEEAAVNSLFLNEPGQQHTSLHLNQILVEQARRKAQDMADRLYFAHVDPDGFGPNHWVVEDGYVLPSYYDSSPGGNNIESIAAGYGDANAVWTGWMNSSGHKMHLLGEHDFYREQIDYGIGHVYKDNGSFGHYWVILIAKPAQ